MSVKPIPDGYHSLTPYLILNGAADAIEFYKKAFGAVERMRMPMPEGKIGHAEIQIGNSVIMLADESEAMGAKSAASMGGSPVMMHLYVDDSDAVMEKAVAEGARVIRPIKDQFYGDRSGMVEDPFGYQWAISTHVEDVPPEEMEKRAAAAMKEGCATNP